MTMSATEVLIGYLQRQREAVVWKLDGLSEHDVRRPLTPTATNLLGLVKHLAGVELGYFSECLGREPGLEPLWDPETGADNEDMFATASESREQVVEFYRAVAAHTDSVVAELGLDHVGEVPWWPEERRHPTVQTLLVHMIQETARHAGHADILREQLDGAVGVRQGTSNVPEDDYDWAAHYDRVQAVADHVA